MEYLLQELLTGQAYEVLSAPHNHTEVTVSHLCFDSRKAAAGSFFFCLTGANADGHAYAQSAYDQGARIFAVERPVELPDDATVVRFANTRAALAATSAVFYGHPCRHLRLIGITGTKGKTTTALLIKHILEKARVSVGYIGTNGVFYDGRHIPTVNTTPESLELQGHLYDMVKAGVEAVVLEVSSQALWMHRVDSISFDSCLFTNLYRDHVGGCEHPTFEHYRDRKKDLFTNHEMVSVFCNADDPWAAYMTEDRPAGTSLVRVSLSDPTCEWHAHDVAPFRKGAELGVTFGCTCGDGHGTGYLNLAGAFNVSNALMAVAVCHDRFGVSLDTALAALADVSVAGRLEPVCVESMTDVTFLVDYAHNGASLEAALNTLRSYRPQRLICLFGSVGTRSFERRPQLAEAAGRLADFCIVTSDNPGKEPPEQIVDEILAAFPEDGCPRIGIVDRAEAIEYAVRMARAGDIVLLAGKGHEDYQLIGTEKIPFSEREILLKAATLTDVAP
jgi:UDP-N-acetylmuramoyl-L-alanyl-D-glutamate--2,6-diaminopimelate ligase